MIQEITISSTEDLIRHINDLPNNFVYRGHANASWNLETSLERLLQTKWSAENVRIFEERSLTEFRSKFHLYDRENVEPISKLAWLSVMQHYGVPTRLLDFTESPYVALFFAMEYYNPLTKSNFSVHALDYTGIIEVSADYIRVNNSHFQESRQSIHGHQDEVFDKFVDPFAHDILWVTEPRQLNARIDRQVGSFLLSGNRGKRIQETLESTLYANVEMKKFVIDHELYECVFALLRKMNITSKTMYGDLHGLANSIRMEMQVYSV